jgi:hypothetical protein
MVALFPKTVDQGERACKLLTQRCSRLSLILGSGKLGLGVGQLGAQVIDSIPQCVSAGPLTVPPRLCPLSPAALGPEVFRGLVQRCLDPCYVYCPLLALSS